MSTAGVRTGFVLGRLVRPYSLVVDRGPDDGGQGKGFNGGQLLLLALGACFVNDVFREADSAGLEVLGVRVLSSSGLPRPARKRPALTRVEAEAPETRSSS